MASIKGFELRKIVKFRGHEQEPLCQGDIYHKGKKVGFYSEDFYGGGSHIEFDNSTLEDIANAACKAYFSEKADPIFEKYKIVPQLSEFFYELAVLTEKEKNFKKYLKSCPEMRAMAYYIERDNTGREYEYFQCCCSEQSVDKILSSKTKRNVEIYRNLLNFIL